MLAPKKDGSLRFCVDYRKLNVIIVRDVYPLPFMNRYIDSLEEVTVLLKLEAISEYWQTETDKRDRDKTAFTFYHGLYRFTRIPFVLRSALATFQGTTDVIFASVR